MQIWGRGSQPAMKYFEEYLPSLFERTLTFDRVDLRGGQLRWIFTGDDGGVTVSVADSTVEIAKRIYSTPGLRQLPGAPRLKHPEYVITTHRATYESPLRTVSVTMDHRLLLAVAVNGKGVYRRQCEIDLTRHQLGLTSKDGVVRGTCVAPAAAPCEVMVDPAKKHQTILGFGGIATPTAYAELTPEGRRRWWELVCEYNLLVQREYPIGTRLNREADNWDRLADATPHYYGDNFPNGEISDFDYIRTLRKLGGMAWFEFWRLPPWTCQDWRDASGKLHRGVVDPKKYVEAMLSYCRASQRKAGAPPDVVGIQNEIHQPSPLWYEMTLALRKGLDDAGFNKVRIHMSDASSLHAGTTWLKDLRGSPAAWAATDYVATHMYDYQSCFNDPDAFDAPLRQWRELAAGKPLLSTELCVNSSSYQWKSYRLAFSMGQLYHKNLVLADASALCYCWTLLNVVQPSYGWTRTLCVLDPANGFVPAATSDQLRVFGAFSRRLRQGMVRLDARSTDPDVLICAFAGSGGEKTLIATNRSTGIRQVSLRWPGAAFTEVELVDPYHANETIDAATISSGSVTLAPGSIVTLTNVPKGRLPDDFVIEGLNRRQ
jgi:O-glycosyl hydrolase